MFPSLMLVLAVGIPPCWDIFDAALRHSAMSMHPPYVHYDERILVTEDSQRLVQTTAHVDYRDDGLARVEDERFNYEPILTRHYEPGPPELGPYGASREGWLPQSDVLPTIVRVRSQGDLLCKVKGVEAYKTHTTYHLDFTGTPTRPSIKEIWVDTSSYTIWKVIVSGHVRFDDDSDGSSPLANFEVELGYADRYLVVNHVVWQYRRREYSQVSTYFGEYTLTGYAFPNALPDAWFDNSAAFVAP